MDELALRLEVVGAEPEVVCAAVARELWVTLGFRPRVEPAPTGLAAPVRAKGAPRPRPPEGLSTEARAWELSKC